MLVLMADALTMEYDYLQEGFQVISDLGLSP